MTPSETTVAADPIRQAAYRRLALTILALDVPTLTSRLQVSRLAPSTLPTRPKQLVKAA